MDIYNFKHGCNKQKEDARDRQYKAKATDWKDLGDIDLRANCSNPRMQGNIASCTAFAATSMFDFVRRKHSMVTWQPSPLFTYYATRLPLDPDLADSGATIRDALKSTVRDGVSMERVWPYIIEKYNERPSDEAWLIAEKHQTIEYLKMDDYNRNEWLNCLNDGYPFIFGANLYTSFFDPIFTMLGGFMQDPDRFQEKIVGAHCMMAVGYIKNYNGKSYLIAQNSWGQEWGDKGYCYLPMSYVMSNDTFDFWTIRLTETSDEYASDAVVSPEPKQEILPEPEKEIVPEPEKEIVPEPEKETVVSPRDTILAPETVDVKIEEESKINKPFAIVMLVLIIFILLFLFS